MSNRKNYYYRQIVTESELDEGFDHAEAADRALMVDQALIGIFQGATPAQDSGGASLDIELSGPAVIYDQLGQRIFWGPTQTVDCSIDEDGNSTAVAGGGNARIISVFAEYDRLLSDSRVDGNGATIYFERSESFKINVVAGAEVTSGSEVAPALRATQVLICDITLTNGQTTILTGGIDTTTRREDAFVLTGSPGSERGGTTNEILQAFQDQINTFVNGGIAYGGGGAWADGTTNPATTVELQLDKVITDLATGAGAAKIAAAAGTAWADGTTNPAERLDQRVDSIITDLAGVTGSAKLQTAAGPAWHDGTTNPLERLDQRIDSIVSDLVANEGADRIGVAASTAGLIVAANSIQDSLQRIETQFGGNEYYAMPLEASQPITLATVGNAGAWTWSDAAANDAPHWRAGGNSQCLIIPCPIISLRATITEFLLFGDGPGNVTASLIHYVDNAGLPTRVVKATSTDTLGGFGSAMGVQGLSVDSGSGVGRYAIEVYTSATGGTYVVHLAVLRYKRKYV